MKLVRVSIARRVVLGSLLAAAAFGCAFAGQASAAGQTSAHAAKGARIYNKNAVFKAFGHQGLPLYDTGYNDFNPVTALASIRPHDGWSLGVYIFRSKKLALVDYKATAKQWKRAGMAVSQVENVVVTAVPKGASLSRPAKPWPMPQLVLNAIAALSGKKS